MFSSKSRSKFGADSLISLGYLGSEDTDTEETKEEQLENWNEMNIED